MRKSSPGKPKPGRRQNPHRFSQRSFVRGAALAAVGQFQHAVGELADGRERPGVAAQAERLFEPARAVAPAADVPSANAAGISASATTSASSLITAAGRDGGLLAAGFAQLELQAPAVLALFRIGPDFERADFGELRAELHRHQSLAGFSEAQYGVERGMQMQLARRALGAGTRPRRRA